MATQLMTKPEWSQCSKTQLSHQSQVEVLNNLMCQPVLRFPNLPWVKIFLTVFLTQPVQPVIGCMTLLRTGHLAEVPWQVGRTP